MHRFYTYELVGGWPAVDALRGCLAVRGHGDHCHVDWDVELRAADGADALRARARRSTARYGEALERLRGQLERAVAAA